MNRARSIILGFSVLIVVTIISLVLYRASTSFSSSNDFPLEYKWWQKFDSQVEDISVIENASIGLVRTVDGLYAIDVKTGDVIWKISISYQVDPSPALASNGLVFLVDQKMLWALDSKNGQVIWSQPISYSNGRVVSVSTQIVLVNETSAYIHSYDAKTGLLLWSIPTGRGPVQAYIDESNVYITDHGVREVDELTGKTLWNDNGSSIGSSDYSNGVIYYITGDTTVAFDAHPRSELWREDFEFSSVGFPSLKMDKFYLFLLDGDGVGLVDKKNGKLIWHTSIPQPSNLIVMGDKVLILEGINRVIHAIDVETGNKAGTLRVSSRQLWFTDSQDIAATDGILLISSGDKVYGFEE